ncbi:MAG: acyltransferase [Lactobacillus amylovorus]|nr:acyltransferase [Lactobacillus amylovorus]
MKKRLSKFEVIRILAMFLIVLHHSIVHGVCDVNQSLNPVATHFVNSGIAYILGSGGIVGVYLFVLITGYFMINSKISFGKLIKLWLPIFFWSLFLFLFLGNHLSIKELIKAIFPILFGKYWFMTVYVFMYCLIPVLNNVVNSIKSKKELLYLGIVSLFIIGGAVPKLGLSIIASRLADFCIIYCVGAIIRKQSILKNEKYVQLAKKLFTVFILGDVLGIFALTCAGGVLNKVIFIKLSKDIVIHHWTMIGIVEAITLFIMMGASNIGYHPVINRIATCMFGIYLISDNEYMQKIIWYQLFNMRHALNYPWWLMIVYVLGVTVAVFVCCGILEYVRQLIFSKFEKWAYVKGNKFQEKIGLEF